jgi:23S rRNA (cytidine2498-2'-O)-methyltransferase
MASEALQLAGENWDAVHVFSRDEQIPGSRGFEPLPTPLVEAIRGEFAKLLPTGVDCSGEITRSGAEILDVILIEPNHWLIGFHRGDRGFQCWPGGVLPIVPPTTMVSRAYLKMAEALAWSELPIRSGDKIVEIGSAPGGACQRLLDLGLEVTGIDAAEMDPLIVKNPRFEHWRGKSNSIKRKRFSKFRWLAADANVAPQYTLDAVEDLVQYPTSRFEGLLMTFKLSNYDLLDHLPDYLQRVRSWGFDRVEARQLSFNRRECCVVAER